MQNLPPRPPHLAPAGMKKPKRRGTHVLPQSHTPSLVPTPAALIPEGSKFEPKISGKLPTFPHASEESGSMSSNTFDIASLTRMLAALPARDLSDISSTLSQAESDWTGEMEAIFGRFHIGDDVLTDPESDRAHSKQAERSDAAKRRRMVAGFERETKKKVKEALENAVVFETFNLTDRLSTDAKRDTSQVSEPPRTWDDDTSRIAVGGDGVRIVGHFPGYFGAKANERLNTIFMTLGKAVKLSVGGGADCQGRNTSSSYVRRKGELAGVFKLVTGWHAVGHPNLNSVCGMCDNLQELSVTSSRINSLIEQVDPSYYAQLQILQSRILKKYPYARALNAIDPLLMEGRAIMFNRRTPLHADHADPHGSWAVLFVTGIFTVGYLFIPQLNLRLRYRPGDVVLLRGRELPHEVEAWVGGQRISIAHFTHQSVWDEHGVKVRVQTPSTTP
ncbi:hypothetical protein JAAARDRAFT_45327 [Jaapia argillacea MUCL 33604]|uniref:Uncharacterized protein n=1 Tax=Jaapia argillacea MUCL 33604 TaxID=933084 RepID=A0A067QGW7_9AGAM|nr:hypothetical protein JAAARDRAFT_45327 [Jaapia argillacea MUCL 33604]